MSSSLDTSKRSLVIDTGVPTAEIFVIDGENTVVARGVQSLQQELAVGIYKVRFRIGNTVADGLFELPAGEGTYTPKDLPAVPLSSPVPLDASENLSASSTAGIAAAWSKTVHVPHGSGSGIFIFVDAPGDSSPPIAADSVTVRTFQGTEIASLAQGVSGQGCFGCSINLDPGGYILRVTRGDSPAIEQAVYAVSGLQTQIFLPVLQSKQASIPDLSAGGMLMSPLLSGFRPDSQSFRWAEAARRTLASGRMGVTPAQQLDGMEAVGPNDPMIEGMLEGKFLSPMLGIYGGHLMAAQNNPQYNDVIRKVVTNLKKLVGDIPDVTSLLLYLNDSQKASLSYPFPPMLAASWSLIVQHSQDQDLPNLVPAGSLSANIAGSLWGSGAWLEWKATEAQTIEPASSAADIDWGLLLGKVSGADTSGTPRIDLNPVERAVMSYLAVSARQVNLNSKLELSSAVTPDAVKQVTPQRIATATGLPYSVLLDAAASLTKKFK
jgi:hypothetical protein